MTNDPRQLTAFYTGGYYTLAFVWFTQEVKVLYSTVPIRASP
jgi:hypothetical protein